MRQAPPRRAVWQPVQEPTAPGPAMANATVPRPGPGGWSPGHRLQASVEAGTQLGVSEGQALWTDPVSARPAGVLATSVRASLCGSTIPALPDSDRLPSFSSLFHHGLGVCRLCFPTALCKGLAACGWDEWSPRTSVKRGRWSVLREPTLTAAPPARSPLSLPCDGIGPTPVQVSPAGG